MIRRLKNLKTATKFKATPRQRLESEIRMRVQVAKRAALLQTWADQIREHKQSGMTVEQWASAAGYSAKTYYYRLKCVREGLLAVAEPRNVPDLGLKPTFAALAMPQANGAVVTVRIGQHLVEISNDADSRVIEQALKAVSRL